MKKAAIFPLFLCLTLCAASIAGAEPFDCQTPPFGETLKSLNATGDFVKYKEKGGVEYYNYTGPCRLNLHEYVAPLVVYAFVDGKLYARIVYILGSDNQDVNENLLVKNLTETYGKAPKIERSGDWTHLSLKMDDNVKYKVKFNRKTRESKSAMYYEPLREAATWGAPTELQ